MEARPNSRIHNDWAEVVEDDLEFMNYFDVGSGYEAEGGPSQPYGMPDRTPTPESEREPRSPSPECGMMCIPEGTFNVSGCGMHWVPVHGGCPVQQQPGLQPGPQPGPAVPKAMQVQEGCAYSMPMNQPQSMDMWQPLYQPPAYQPPPAMSCPSEQGMQIPGLTQNQLQALEQDPDLAAVFQDVRRNGPAAALRAFQDEGLMVKISKKIQSPGAEGKLPSSMPQSADAKAGCGGPAHGGPAGRMPMPKAHGVPHAGSWDDGVPHAQGFACPSPGAQAMMPPRAVHRAPGHQFRPVPELLCPRRPPGARQGGAAVRTPHQGEAVVAQATPPLPAGPGPAPVRPPGQTGPAKSSRGLNAIDAAAVISGAQRMDETVVNQVILKTIRQLQWSVCLADPNLDDCPIVGCSEGFEALTGYSKKEIIGKNCRFLNEGIELKQDVRSMLQEAAASRGEFVGSLPNIRKNGELFENLLHMTTLTVRGKRYIIGIQADVTNLTIDMSDPGHLEELQAVAARIFSSNIDAWVQMQVREFAIRQPVPYSKVLMKSDSSKYLEAMGNFVHIACNWRHSRLMQPQECQLELDGNLDTTGNVGMDGSTGGDSDMAGGGSRRAPVAEPGVRQAQQSAPEGSSDDQRAGEAALKSLGSAGHPDHCQAECVFHFFRGGCKGGSNCRFCHEFHPRKNPKKNRRALRRFIANAGGCEDGQGPCSSSVDPLSICNNHDDLPPSTGGNERQVSEASSTYTVLPERFEFAPDAERLGSVKVSYGPEQRVTLLAGVRLRLAPQVEISAGCKATESSCLHFSVDHPLPQGLSLESTTGVISGVPTECIDHDYTITVGTEAIGLGSMKLGLVPITASTLSLSVVDLQAYTASWGIEDEDGCLKLCFHKSA